MIRKRPTPNTIRPCESCGRHVSKARCILKWRTFDDGTRHIERRCPSGHYLDWAPQSDENIRLADAYIDPQGSLF